MESRISEGGGLRRRAARGTLVNGAYLTGLQALGLVKGFAAAAFLTPDEYGVWGILAIILVTFIGLRYAGAADRYIQQQEPDQQLAFQRGFTADLIFSTALGAALALALPLLALMYGRPEIITPGLVLAFTIPLAALQFPAWVFYRRMDFVRQRLLQGVDPVVTVVVTIALAASGGGYWSLVVGALAGSVCATLAALIASPYRLAWRYERGSLRDYATFSWPLLLATGVAIVMAQATIVLGEATLGLAGVGAIYLTVLIAQTITRIDETVLQTLYPAICAVRERTDLLFESFTKTNRLLLMTGAPLALAITLFAPDLIEFVLGEKWQPAEVMLQVYGLLLVIDRVAFGWKYFYKAVGRTQPFAVTSLALLVAFSVFTIPLLALEGLTGFGVGMTIAITCSVFVRLHYVRRLFPDFRVAAETLRAVAPSVAAVGAVLVARLVTEGERTVWLALAELGLFVSVALILSFVSQRALLQEIYDLVRRAGTPPPPVESPLAPTA